MGYAEKVLQPGETIVYRARLHWIIYLGGILFVIVAVAAAIAAVALNNNDTLRIGLLAAAVIALAVGLFHIVRAWLRQATTEIIVTNRRIIYKRGVITLHTLEMNLDKVESVLVQQGLIGRMLDYGTVLMRGVGSGIEPVRVISRPLALHRYVNAAGAS